MALGTKERILEAAGRVLSANPNASVDQIATEARVGRATVFRHFDSRAGLLRALGRHAVAETDRVARQASARAGSATEALRLVVQAVVGAGESFRFLESIGELQDDPEIAAAYERQMSEFTDLVRGAAKEGFIRPDFPAAWAAASIDALIWAACRAVDNGEIGLLQAQDLVWDTIRGGLSTDAAKTHQHVGWNTE